MEKSRNFNANPGSRKHARRAEIPMTMGKLESSSQIPSKIRTSFFSAAISLSTSLVVLLSSMTATAEKATQDNPTTSTYSLSEEAIIQLSKKPSPATLRLHQNLNQIEFDQNAYLERFSTRWVSEARHQNSEEKAIASFIPTFGPTFYFATGLEKQLHSGANISASVFTDQQSTSDNFIDRATRTGVKIGADLDLWKNLFGRLDKAEIKSLEIRKKKTELQNKIDRKVFELDLRKIYWSLVANNEKLNTSKKLLEISKKQLSDGLQRRNQFIADRAEIAKYRAQVSSRSSTIHALEYQRATLIQQLKERLPSISQSQIELASYDAPAKVLQVLSCSVQISKSPQVPWNYTLYDEVLQLAEQELKQNKIKSQKYDGADLKLSSQVQLSGVDQGYGNSVTDFGENGKVGYQVGLQLSVPLGSTSEKSQKLKEKIDQQKFEIDRQNLRTLVLARHSQIISLMKLLQKSIVSLNDNNKNLQTSIDEVKKKYKQARASVNDLLNDQDALFNSTLTEIDTKLEIIHLLLDYFKTFNDHPCPTNNIALKTTNEVRS